MTLKQSTFGRRSSLAQHEAPVLKVAPIFGRRGEMLDWQDDPGDGTDRFEELVWRLCMLLEAVWMQPELASSRPIGFGEHAQISRIGNVITARVYLPETGSVVISGSDVDDLLDGLLYFALIRPIDKLSISSVAAAHALAGRPLGEVLRQFTQETVVACHGDTAKAADWLGISLYELEHFASA